MVAILGLVALWSLFSLFERFLILSCLFLLLIRPSCWQYILIESLMSSHWLAVFMVGWGRIMCSMVFVCFFDLRREELKRQIGDLLSFFRVSERSSAGWAESDPVLGVVSGGEGGM